jgi:hypothetical protein
VADVSSQSCASFSQFAASNSQKALSSCFDEPSAFLRHRSACFLYSSVITDKLRSFRHRAASVRTPLARMLPRVVGGTSRARVCSSGVDFYSIRIRAKIFDPVKIDLAIRFNAVVFGENLLIVCRRLMLGLARMVLGWRSPSNPQLHG